MRSVELHPEIVTFKNFINNITAFQTAEAGFLLHTYFRLNQADFLFGSSESIPEVSHLNGTGWNFWPHSGLDGRHP